MSSIVVTPRVEGPWKDESYSASDAVSMLWEATVSARKAEPQVGKGTKDEPYRLSQTAEWLWVAEKRVKQDTFIEIGDRRILWRGFDSYIIDNGSVKIAQHVPTLKSLSYNKINEKEKSVHPASAFISVKDPDARFGTENGASYPEIYRQLAADFRNLSQPDVAADVARQIRLLVGGQPMDHMISRALPMLTCAWFLAEVSRNPTSLGSGLMLLDLIELKTTYQSPTGEPYRYTWDKALWHPEIFDAEQRYFDFLQNNVKLASNNRNLASNNRNYASDDLHKTAETLRDQKHKVKDEKVTPILVENDKLTRDKRGGDHPMAHDGSVKQSKISEGQKPTQRDLTTPVRQKEACIVARWLSISTSNQVYAVEAPNVLLTKAPPPSDLGEVMFGHPTKKTGKSKIDQFKKINPFGSDVIRPKLLKRLGTWELLDS